jgi:hypothetical protein
MSKEVPCQFRCGGELCSIPQSLLLLAIRGSGN